jgi:uncharacterized membrane protein
MNRRPGHVTVTTEVAYCSFCDRVRNLRREAHLLGTRVRTIVTCETCHRTLSSTMGVAEASPEGASPAAAEKVTAPAPAAPAKPARKPVAKQPAASPAAAKKASGPAGPTKARAPKTG